MQELNATDNLVYSDNTSQVSDKNYKIPNGKYP